jgi:hypothetical protein
MEIKPTYVTFEQAKSLKEKGCNISSNGNWWILAKDHSENYRKKLPVDESKIFFTDNDEELNSYTTIDEETEHNVYHVLSAPEQWQVVEWLRVNHGIWVNVYFDTWNTETYDFSVCIKGRKDYQYDDFTEFDSPQEAYSAAFDYVLNNLI